MSLSPALPTAEVYAAVDTKENKLNDLVIDKVYELEPIGDIPEGIVCSSSRKLVLFKPSSDGTKGALLTDTPIPDGLQAALVKPGKERK